MSDLIWKQRGGAPIKVCDMEESHVVNARNMMQRNLATLDVADYHPDDWTYIRKAAAWTKRWIAAFNDELKRRADNEQG